MNKFTKIGCVAVAMALVLPAGAGKVQELTEGDEGVVGWTAIEAGIASPVQIPWGMARWDIKGVGIDLFYNDAPIFYGLGFCGGVTRVREEFRGFQASLFGNWNEGPVYGIRSTIGVNFAFGETSGWDMGMFGLRFGDMYGLDTELLGSYQNNFTGLGLWGLVSFTGERNKGLTITGIGNISKEAVGCHVGGVFNFTDSLDGAQIGLINFARECPFGFQIGLINVIMDNKVKILPVFNGYF